MVIKNQISRILTLLCWTELTNDEAQELKDLWVRLFYEPSLQDLHFQILFELTKLNCVEPLVYRNLKRYQLRVPQSFAEHLHQISQQIQEQNQARLRTGQLIFDELHKAHISFLILKGQVFASLFYRDENYKKMNDIDFLVHKRDLGKISEIYQRLGYLDLASLHPGDHRKQEKYSHHWPPFISPDLRCVLGTHWNLVSPLSGIQLDPEVLWQNARAFSYLGHPAFRLSNEWQLLHLLLHLSHFKTGLKETADIVNLLRWNRTAWDWPQLTENLRQVKGLSKAFYSLSLVNALDPSLNLGAVLESWKPFVPRSIQNESTHKTRELYFVVRSRSTHLSRIEKNYGLFSLTENFFEKVVFLAKMWQAFLWIPRQEVLKMRALKDDSSFGPVFWQQLQGPFFISQIFAFEMGWKLHFLLILRHHFELLKSFSSLLTPRHRKLKELLSLKGFQEAQFFQLKNLLE